MSHNQQASEYLAEQNTPSPEKTEELPVLHAGENVDRGLFNIDLQTGYPMIYQQNHHQCTERLYEQVRSEASPSPAKTQQAASATTSIQNQR